MEARYITCTKNTLSKAFIIMAVSFSFLRAEAQTIFTKLYGGEGTDSNRSLVVTSDGGYISVGHATTSSGSLGYADFLVIRTDANGEAVWQKMYGGSGVEHAFEIIEAHDGNYIIAGFSTSPAGAGGQDAYLIKIDGNGNLIWEKYYGGTGTDGIESVQRTDDGGYITCGYSTSSGTNGGKDVFVVKTDDSGNEVWSKKIGGSSDDWGNIIRNAVDGGYIIIGYTISEGAGMGDYYLVKISSGGDYEWSKTYGGAEADEGKYIKTTSDGGYIITGDTRSEGAGDDDIKVIKTDAVGNEEWSKTYGGEKKEASKMIETTSDGGYIIAGITRSFGLYNPDMWVVKINSAGSMQWDKKFGFSGHEHGYAAKELADGNYILLGHTDDNLTDEQVMLVKFADPASGNSVEEVAAENVFSISPNPSTGVFELIIKERTIKDAQLQIYNFTGSLLYSDIIAEEKKVIDMNTFAKGIYLVNINTNENNYARRIIIE